MKVAVVGLGKLGSVLAAVLADAGHEVVGTDLMNAVVDKINDGVSPVQEPGLQELIDGCRDRLWATVDTGVAVSEAEVIFIVVPTPSDESGGFSNKYVLEAVRSIGKGLRERPEDVPDYPVIVVCSTVMPGSTNGEIRKALENSSGLKVGTDIGLCYSPEFIALGTVIRDMQNPDMVLVGESDSEAGKKLEAALYPVVKSKPKFHHMSIASAEVAKISVNAFVTMKISFANALAEICEGVVDADAYQVTGAIGDDSRIGKKYLIPATAYGGPCFPRDSKAFAALARSVNASSELAVATDVVNDRQIQRIWDKVEFLTLKDEPIGVLGLSYKPGTPVTEESPSIRLVSLLQETEHPVFVYDPIVKEHPTLTNVTWSESQKDLIMDSQLVVVMTPDPKFLRVKVPKDKIVLDIWNMLDPLQNRYTIGRLIR